MTRHDLARSVARSIEQFDRCDILSTASIAAIEDALARYASEQVGTLRANVVAQTWNAREKESALALVDETLARVRA